MSNLARGVSAFRLSKDKGVADPFVCRMIPGRLLFSTGSYGVSRGSHSQEKVKMGSFVCAIPIRGREGRTLIPDEGRMNEHKTLKTRPQESGREQQRRSDVGLNTRFRLST
ncbi:unnamed protein product [Prunus armeniaca]|uniref:Uncharacterized protein n=1 Tax=Prunus armeniaca TaxID=36596 RepID=A0A6J5UDG1_PRUAR|nr:unnamed protein product [Prunus armeniaca]